MQFQTRSELVNHYAQVRRNLWGKPVKAAVALPPPVEPEPLLTIPKIVPRAEKVGPWAFNPWKARQMIARIAEKHGVTYDEVVGPNRYERYILPRFECCYRLKVELGLSFPDISRKLGRSDHTSSLSGYRRYKKYLETGSYPGRLGRTDKRKKRHDHA